MTTRVVPILLAKAVWESPAFVLSWKIAFAIRSFSASSTINACIAGSSPVMESKIARPSDVLCFGFAIGINRLEGAAEIQAISGSASNFGAGVMAIRKPSDFKIPCNVARRGFPRFDNAL